MKVIRVGRFWYVRVVGLAFQPFLTRREARAFVARRKAQQS